MEKTIYLVSSCHTYWIGNNGAFMIRSFAFTTQGQLQSKNIEMSALAAVLKDTSLFVWIDLEKPSPEEIKTILEDTFHFHPLSIEDCVQLGSAPKVEEYIPKEDDQFSNYLFIVMHAVDYNRQEGGFATSELNFFLGKNFLVTFHDVPLRSVKAVEDRCLKSTTPIARAPDRLAHSLLDALADNYKPALDQLSLEIGKIEEEVLQAPQPQTLNRIIQIKKQVFRLQQIIGPQSEVLMRLTHGEYKLIRNHLIPYYRDVYDSIYHISEQAQNYTNSLTGILQVYLNMSSNQTGEVVKLLTMITLITTPMMMIGTWYGMNFANMPELKWAHGYELAIGLTVVSTAATYWFFKSKKWF